LRGDTRRDEERREVLWAVERVAGQARPGWAGVSEFRLAALDLAEIRSFWRVAPLDACNGWAKPFGESWPSWLTFWNRIMVAFV
jgi:hypothetical protein